jgi:hypothetical protein
MEQFSLALNVYGLKDDVIELLAGEVTRFAVEISLMRARLKAVIDRARCYYFSCDTADARNLREIRGLLAG